MTPNTLSDILHALRAGQVKLDAHLGGLALTAFYAHPPEVWSPADHVQHLDLSYRQLLWGLRLPKLVLLARFGRPQRASRDFATVKAAYYAKLAEGFGATPAVIGPLIAQAQATAQTRASLMQTWRESAAAMLERVAGWDDAALDAHQVPHPAIGMLTMREMLFFFVFHDAHHLADLQT